MPWPEDNDDFDPESDPFLAWFDDPRVTANCIPFLYRCLQLPLHDSKHKPDPAG